MVLALSLLAGTVFLILGAQLLVRGASSLATAMGVTPLVIGLTVVAFGTSAPEFAVSIDASLSGKAGIALGNVVGSNIFNVLFILGLSAIIVPLSVDARLVKRDAPLMALLSVFVLLLALDGRIGRMNGGVLALFLVAYLGYLFHHNRREDTQSANSADSSTGADAPRPMGTLASLALVAVGLGLLIVGSRLLVEGATIVALRLGLSEVVIGLTIVSAGTSLPEVVTSLVAAVRGQRDIAVGNVLGSNIFNIMGVLGVAGIIAPGGMEVAPAMIGFDLPIMVAVACLCLPVFFTGNEISRVEGSILLACYIGYTTYLILASTAHDALPAFHFVTVYFALPVTALVLAYLVWQEVKRRRRIL